MTENNDKKSLRERYIETQQNAFIREVDDAVKISRAAEFWRRWKKYIITAIVVVLAVTVIKNMWDNRRERIVIEQAKRFERITANPAVSDEGRILELLDFAKTARYGYRDIAYFDIVTIHMENNRMDDAAKTLETIVDTTNDRAFRNLAILKLALMKEYTDTKEGMEKSVQRLSRIRSSHPFSHAAKASLALLYIKQSELDKADNVLDRLLSSEDAPASLKQQAQTLKNHVKSMRAVLQP